GRVDQVQKRLARSDVSERMVVVGRAFGFAEESRLDERDVRQRAGCCVRKKRFERTGNRQVAQSPEREKRDVVEVITALETGAVEPIPDRRQNTQLERVAQTVGLGRVL